MRDFADELDLTLMRFITAGSEDVSIKLRDLEQALHNALDRRTQGKFLGAESISLGSCRLLSIWEPSI